MHTYEEGFLSITPNTRGTRESGRHRHFSCLDLKSGFWQIRMDEASKQYTAFTVGNLGFFECDRMPFGLCNAPATFQRLMQNCMGELNFIYCLIYLDDLIVFLHEQLRNICTVYMLYSTALENTT